MRILVVDDSRLMRSVIIKELLGLGFEEGDVHEAHNGADALRKIKTETFGLMILDIVMPGIDGVAVLREVKDIQPNAKVIMCSNFSPKGTVEELISIGIDDFLLKPFSVERFRQVVLRNLPGT